MGARGVSSRVKGKDSIVSASASDLQNNRILELLKNVIWSKLIDLITSGRFDV